jgi:membrane protease YdiL (CAAX protease family)
MAIAEDGSSAASEPPVEVVVEPESAGRLILIAIGWCLLTEITSGAPVGFAVSLLKHLYSQNVSIGSPISITVMLFLTGCTLLVAVRQRSAVVGHGNRRAGVGDQPIKRWWFLVLLGLLAVTWAFIAAAFWNAVLPQWASSWRNQSPWVLISYTIATVILAPLAEELFFRGWLWTGLRQHWRAFPTGLLSSSLWVIVHISRGFLVPIILIPMAVILGFARHFCGIRAAIILHAIYNLVVALVLMLLLTSTV